MLMEKIEETQTATHPDILTVLTSIDEQKTVIDFAEALAGPEGHLRTVLLAPLPEIVYAIHQGAAVPIVMEEMLARARDEAKVQADRLSQIVNRLTCSAEAHLLAGELSLVSTDLVMAARHADLTIFERPTSSADKCWEPLIDVLFRSGRPIFVTPPGWRRFGKAEKVLVAWNASRESARALGDAAPFLAKAKGVRVITVDAKPSYSGFGELPGADITTHLARHGVKAELSNLASGGAEVGAVIGAEAKQFGADLLVLGGFGHSRFGEFIFGGVTRHLLTHAPCPMLLSH